MHFMPTLTFCNAVLLHLASVWRGTTISFKIRTSAGIAVRVSATALL